MPGHPILTISQGGDPSHDAPALIASPLAVTSGVKGYISQVSDVPESSQHTSRVALSSLEALRQMALKGAVKKEQLRTQGPIAVLTSPDWEHGRSYAAPLSPLRTQDNQALAEFFDRGDINTIEDDVLHMLDRLSPEPCWEDDPFQFLGKFV